MKALTLTQPWATLIALGAKTIETRSWATAYRGPLAIHAAKGLGPVGGVNGLDELICSYPFWDPLYDAGVARTEDLPLGAIVAVCNLIACYPTCGDGCYRDPDRRVVVRVLGQERAFGDYSPGRFAWLLAGIRALPEPIPCRGALGLWDIPAEIAAQLGQEPEETRP